MKNKTIKDIIYWLPYVPILGYIIITVLNGFNVKHDVCFIYVGDYNKTKVKYASLHFVITILIQVISLLLLIKYLLINI